jgi:hypothetical protein
MGFCDACNLRNEQLLVAAEASHVPTPVNPDELSPGVLYIGPKEAAFSRDTLRRFGITRVLICCERLLSYHDPETSGVRYHRLPLADSLSQGLSVYLPSALAFIAQGALVGERTLVHW